MNVKFLIIRLSSIGDIVLTTPVLRMLKQQVENAEIHFLVKEKYIPVIENNPYIHKIHIYTPKDKDFFTQLKDEHFHHIIDLHHNLRTFLIKRKIPAYHFSFNKLNIEKWLYVNFKKNKLPNLHIVDRYLDTVKLFDIKNDNKGLDHFISVKDEVNLLSLPEEFTYGYIAFAIGAQHFTKRMPADKIAKICNKVNLPVILLGAEEDFKNGEKIKQAGFTNKILNSCGSFNINQSASLIRQAKLVITHDTGLMHIAAAYKKRIISLWGNTVPEFGMYPYQADVNSFQVEVPNLKCRPCSKIGHKQCPKKHFHCMNKMETDKIAELANLLLLKAFN